MGSKTKIEWTRSADGTPGSTWNPIRGCSKVSAGCKNCYAETMAARFAQPPPLPIADPTEIGKFDRGKPGPYFSVIKNKRWNGVIEFQPHLLDQPLRWTKPRIVFVNSMSDLFHENLPFEKVAAIFGVMAAATQHTFKVLTKRPKRMLEFFEYNFGLEDTRVTVAREAGHYGKIIWDSRGSKPELYGDLRPDISNRRVWPGWPLPNVHLGVSVEDQKTADERIPLLLQCPAAVRFVSAEPLLGGIDFQNGGPFGGNWLEGWSVRPCEPDGEPEQYQTPRLDQIIVGGESGHGARPMHPDWARSIRDQCQAAGVAFFFKQWGDWADFTDDPKRAGKAPEELIFTKSGEYLGAAYRFRGAENGMVESDWKERGAAWMGRVGKHAAGRLLDGQEWSEEPR